MRLRALLGTPGLGLEQLVGEESLEREFDTVVTTDLLDPSRYLDDRSLVLTGLVWRREPADSERFVAALARSGTSALAAGYAGHGGVPDDLVAACRRHRMPLFWVPDDLAFATVTELLIRQISAERAQDVGTLLDRHRRLLAASGGGAGIEPILELITEQLGLSCCVVTAAGDVVAVSGGALARDEATALARAALSAPRLPTRAALRSGAMYSLFRVDGRAGSRAADWFVAFDGDHERWPVTRQDLTRDIADVLSVERERIAERGATRRRIGEELLGHVMAGGEPVAVETRLRVLGIDPGAGLRVVSLALSSPGSTESVLRCLLDAGSDGLLVPCTSVPADHTLPRHAIALIGAAAAPTESLAERLRARIEVIQPALDGDRVAVGISDLTYDPAELYGRLREARQALALAWLRSERQIGVVGHDELASHLLLLAGVPEELRVGYRDRLLGPIRAYDALHHSDLELTLERFLDCSGSWTRCAGELHLHVNTLRYRVAKIAELTGRDLTRLEDQVDFFLALRLR